MAVLLYVLHKYMDFLLRHKKSFVLEGKGNKNQC